MREEGLEKHDISIYVEEKIEYVHSRIALAPLVNGIERAKKLSYLFGHRVVGAIILTLRKCKREGKVVVQVSTPNDRENDAASSEFQNLIANRVYDEQAKNCTENSATENSELDIPEIPVKQSQFQRKE